MKLFGIVHKRLVSGLLALLLVTGVVTSTLKAQALVVNPTPAAKISFTFDDGLSSALTAAAPTLAKYGIQGTDYVVTNCASGPGCPADIAKYRPMNWSQIKTLANTYGWEIGSHTANHRKLSTLTDSQKNSQLSQSKAAFAAQGLTVTDFASPEGDYDNSSIAYIAKYYESHRVFREAGNNVWPYSDYLMNDIQVQGGVTVDTVKAAIDSAILNDQWLVLTFHDIRKGASTNPLDYQYETADLDAIASYAAAKRNAGLIKTIKMNQGLVKSDSNLVANGSFETGMTGWTTDNATAFKLDTGTNGSYPTPKNAIKFTATTTNAHLFGPKVLVDPNASYVFKSFLNVKTLTSGEVYYYVDEYDANGNWVSGQYKKAERSAFVESMNFAYKPSSNGVRYAALQVGMVANSGITGYLDGVQMFATTDATPVVPPAPTNLLPNASFDAGISAGWSTNSPTTIIADSGSHGSTANPVNSVSLSATTVDRHLFSPSVIVDPTKSYSITSYIHVTSLAAGEIGLYVDEYDANGNWISGQYKGGARAVSAGDVSFVYTPSSAVVAKASLQVIVTGNSNAQAYFDYPRWYQN